MLTIVPAYKIREETNRHIFEFDDVFHEAIVLKAVEMSFA